MLKTLVRVDITEELSPNARMSPFFVVTWLTNLSSSDTFKGISGPDSDEKLVPNIIDKYNRFLLGRETKARREGKSSG